MATYVWEGRTATGEIRKGEMDASSDQEVMNRLRAQQIVPNKVKRKLSNIEISIPGMGGVSLKELVVFTRQFSTMIDAGLPLVQCLDLLGSQEPNKSFQKIIFDIKNNVETGATFADSLRKHPNVFDSLYVNLVAAGEVGGVLDTVMNRLAIYIEKNVKLRRKIKSAFTYPLGISVVATGVVLLMMVVVIPTFEEMFADFGAELPGPTQFVINISHFFVDYFLHIIGSIVGLILGFTFFKKTEFGQKTIDTVLLKAPIFGPLVRKAAVAKFTRTLGTMISSGVPILDGLDIVAKAAGNKIVENAIYYTRDRITEGKNMAEPLMETRVFPPMVVQMIGVGEATGALDTMLNKIADFYEEEVDVAVDALTSLLEPMMMVVIGGIVGGLLIAMYLPIFNIAGTVTNAK
ncbi:MAG: pilus assembly protein PilC [Myxococcales bacterium]|nr:pilus assembly protein PilC [Myxococcales bacterium]